MLSTKGDEFIVACQSFLGFGREVMGIRLIDTVERNNFLIGPFSVFERHKPVIYIIHILYYIQYITYFVTLNY